MPDHTNIIAITAVDSTAATAESWASSSEVQLITLYVTKIAVMVWSICYTVPVLLAKKRAWLAYLLGFHSRVA